MRYISIGRPTEDRKDKVLQFRLSARELSALDQYCKDHNTTYSELFRDTINALKGKKEKGEDDV